MKRSGKNHSTTTGDARSEARRDDAVARENARAAAAASEAVPEPASQPASQAGERPSAASTRSSVDQLLRRLEEGARAVPMGESTALSGVASEASGHAEALRETLSAQQEAQELLAMATRVRGAASEQAERIVGEAQEAAERLKEEARRHAERARRETADWAAQQRETIDAVIGELVEAATRDADDIRADALDTAMAEAEKTARQYVARAAARGARDAEVIRAQAREVLGRSSGLVADANTSLHGLAATMTTFVDALQEQLEAMERLLLEAEDRVERHKVTIPLPDDEDWEPAPARDRDDDPKDVAPADETDDTDADATGETDADPTDETEDPGRPLGSLFRGPDER